MSDTLVPRRRPEEEELENKRVELHGLESELAERELGLTSLRIELLAFQAHYMTVVGAHYAELDAIEAEIAERIARSRPSDEKAQAGAAQARTKAQSSASDCQEALAFKNQKHTTSRTLKSLYREVAKRIHPDLATNAADRARRQRLMAEANEAYELGDEKRLRVILEEYEDSPDSVEGEGPAAELVRVIRKIAQVRRRLREIESDLEQIARTDLYVLRDKTSEAKKQGRDLLQEMAAAVKSQIAAARQRLESVSKDAS